MTVSNNDRERLRDIKTFPSLVKYLRDELDWPIQSDDFEEMMFDYEPEELGIDAKTAAKILEIKQLRPLATGQPWGIFFVKFEPKKLPVVVLRRVLRKLVLKKRDSANQADQAAWAKHDLLFISNYGEGDGRQITFAHFTDNSDHNDRDTLKVLGWDNDDTVLTLDHVHSILHEKLRWPQNESALDKWRSRWSSAFELEHREVITSSKELASTLAQLATVIRKRCNAALRVENDNGPITSLMKAFKIALLHDLGRDDFADMYAQTIAYGLLSARASREADFIAENLVDMVPITNPFLRELLKTFLDIGGRKWNDDKGRLTGIDFDELGVNDVVDMLRRHNVAALLRNFGNRDVKEDPVIYFYEDFLKEYDAKKRMQRGVFYTPKPVVSYIVHSVHELLQTEFGLADGLADTTTWGEMLKKFPGENGSEKLKLPEIKVVDPQTRRESEQPIDPNTPFVQILDPATGTATFLVEVIDVIKHHMTAKWKKEGHGELWINQKWNEYVPIHLLPRLHGYELMMAPYAIAHMKIGLKLFETGYKFGSGERARIYLTNALEPPQDFSDTFEQMAPALAHEANAVNAVKRHQRFTVVIGNPPYSGVSVNMEPHAQQLIDAYRIVDGAPMNEKKIWLQDDYVKFIRLAQVLLDETGTGVFGYISNHGYLSNPTFRGMRQSLLSTYRRMRLLDLHGNANKKEQALDGSHDKNVFDIKQGVAICIASCAASSSEILHADLWGERETKYQHLMSSGMREEFKPITPDSPFYFLQPQNIDLRSEYDQGWRVNDFMPVNAAGVITSRDGFVVDFDKGSIQRRIDIFLDEKRNDAEVTEELALSENYAWRVATARHELRSTRDTSKCFKQINYRPFDVRHIYYHPAIVWRPRLTVMQHMMSGANIALLTARSNKTSAADHFFCSRHMSEAKCAEYSTQSTLFPLYLSGGTADLVSGAERRPNFAAGFSDELRIAMGDHPIVRSEISADKIFYYMYAVFYSPTYRHRYAGFLKMDFPRLPRPRSVGVFDGLANIGGELASLHLMEAPQLEKPLTTYTGSANPDVEKLSYSGGTVWLDKKLTCGFAGVPEAVWNFHIGGYQVCQKWLKDRKGRTLSADDLDHYQKIVVALSETIRLMKEIDETIEKHGGWPGAFVSMPSAPAPSGAPEGDRPLA